MQEKLLLIRDLPTAYLEHSFTLSNDHYAPILFFIHGFPDTPWAWHKQFEYFINTEKKTRPKISALIAPWGRGIGKSIAGVGLDRFYPSAVLLDHFAILNEVDPKRERKIIVVGHDIGCVYAWNLASSLGSRLAGLVTLAGLNCEQLFWRFKNQSSQLMKSWYIGLFQVPYFSDRSWKMFEPQIIAMIHKVGKYPVSEENKSQKFRKIQHSLGIYWYRAALRDFFYKNLKLKKEKRVKVSAPTLAISGNKDPFVNPMQLDELRPFSDSAQTRVIQSGHWPHLEKAAQCNRILNAFVANLSGDSSD